MGEDVVEYIHVCKSFDLVAVKDVPESLSVGTPNRGYWWLSLTFGFAPGIVADLSITSAYANLLSSITPYG